MIKLYQFANSVCCQKVRLTLCEKRLEWDTVEVDLTRNAQHDPAYLALNPTGVVPTLVNDREVVIESTLICEYIDEVYSGRWSQRLKRWPAPGRPFGLSSPKFSSRLPNVIGTPGP